MDYRQQEDSSGTNGFAMGVVLGAVAGAGLALLFAPKLGAQLRGEIGESVSSMRDAVSKRVRDVTDRAGAKFDDLHSSVDQTVDKASEAVENTAREMLDTASHHARPVIRPRT